MPMDVIRKRMQVQGPARTQYAIEFIPKYGRKLSVVAIGAAIIRQEGFLSLYKGLLPSLIKVAPASAVTFMVYNFAHKSLLALVTNDTK